MRDHILQVLKQIEIDYEIKVLFACESGSRAWGFSSRNSDYDVRFIYIHKTDWYLSIDHKRDVLEIPKRDKVSMSVDELLDMSGWEFTKALRLFRKSNPTLMEWLHSSIVYHQFSTAVEKMKVLEQNNFSIAACLHHYLNMAKRNYRHCLTGTSVNLKIYLYILHSILTAKWIEQFQTIPPIEFSRLLNELMAPGELKERTNRLLKNKQAGAELNLDLKVEGMNRFIEDELDRLEKYAKGLKFENADPTEQLDQLFRETLLEVW